MAPPSDAPHPSSARQPDHAPVRDRLPNLVRTISQQPKHRRLNINAMNRERQKVCSVCRFIKVSQGKTGSNHARLKRDGFTDLAVGHYPSLCGFCTAEMLSDEEE